MNKGNKCVQKNFRITEVQQKHIEERCHLYGISESELMRHFIDSDIGKPVVVETQERYQQWKQLQYEVNKIGTNINQIVKNVNANYYTAYEKRKLFALMANLTELVSKF